MFDNYDTGAHLTWIFNYILDISDMFDFTWRIHLVSYNLEKDGTQKDPLIVWISCAI